MIRSRLNYNFVVYLDITIIKMLKSLYHFLSLLIKVPHRESLNALEFNTQF